MNTPTASLKHVLVELITKAQLLATTADLEILLTDGLAQIQQVVHEADTLYCEKEISQKYPFLTLIKLRNMRARGNGPKHYKFGESRNSRVYYKLADIESWIAENEQTEPYVDPRFREIMARA